MVELHEVRRFNADHLAARLKRACGKNTHQSGLRAAVNKGVPAFGYPAPKFGGSVSQRVAFSFEGAQVHRDFHKMVLLSSEILYQIAEQPS